MIIQKLKSISLSCVFAFSIALGFTGCPAEGDPDETSGCQADADCGSGRCNMNTNECVTCLSDSDCGEGLVCNANTNMCVESAPCASDADCASGYCDATKSQCVECLITSHCDTGICSGGFCVPGAACTSDADCGDEFCDSQGNCVECYENSHCPSGACNLQTLVCIPGCNDTDITEPNNDVISTGTTTLASGTTHQGSVCPADTDIFRIEAEGDIEIFLTYNRAAGNLTLRLLGDDVAHTAVATCTANSSGLTINQTGISGVHYIEVAGVNLATDVPYQLTALINGGADACVVIDANDEANNNSANGDLIEANGQTHAGSICGDDNDWYRVQLNAGANLHAQALLTTEQIELELRGPNGCPVTNDGAEIEAPCPSNQNYLNTVKGNPITVANLANSGTYYILVTSKLNNDTNYQLKVVADSTAVSNCQQVDVEPNNVGVLANPITPGAPAISGSICAEGHPSGDVDFYTFSANQDDDLQINLTAISGNAVLHQVKKPDGTNLGVSDSIADLDEGVYYLIILGESSNANANYNLSITLTPEPGADPCSEDGITEPIAINADGTPYSGVVCTGDTDTFELTVSEEGTVSLDVTFGHEQADINVEVQNANGDIVAAAESETDNEHAEWGATVGTYTVTLTSQNITEDFVNYTLLATSSDCEEDSLEPNDTTDSAYPLANSTVEGVRCAGDDDFFSINLEQDDMLSVSVTATGGDLELALVDATGAVIQNGNDNSLTYTAITPGTYYLRVSSISEDRITYSLTSSVTSTGCVDDGAEPNNSAPEGTQADTSAVANGQITYADMVLCSDIDDSWEDYYTFELTDAKNISVTFTTGTADAEVGIGIYEITDNNFYGNRYLLFVDDVVNGLETINGHLNGPGTYGVAVFNWSFDIDVQYGLDIQLSDASTSSCVNDRYDSFTSSSDTTNAPNNNTAARAVSMDAETPLSTEITNLQICGGDSDWYSVIPSANQTITVDVLYTYTSLSGDDVDVALYTSASGSDCTDVGGEEDSDTGLCKVAESRSVDDDENLSYLVPADFQTYYVRVFGFSQSENNYDLKINIQ